MVSALLNVDHAENQSLGFFVTSKIVGKRVKPFNHETTWGLIEIRFTFLHIYFSHQIVFILSLF